MFVHTLNKDQWLDLGNQVRIRIAVKNVRDYARIVIDAPEDVAIEADRQEENGPVARKEQASSFIYLACPYSDPDSAVLERRVALCVRAAVRLVKEGQSVFAPVLYTHELCRHSVLNPLHERWYAFDEPFLRAASRFIILRLPGWEKSVGVRRETKIAQEMGRGIEYMDPE